MQPLQESVVSAQEDSLPKSENIDSRSLTTVGGQQVLSKMQSPRFLKSQVSIKQNDLEGSLARSKDTSQPTVDHVFSDD